MKSNYIFPILGVALTITATPVPQNPPLVARDENPTTTSAADNCGHPGGGDWGGTGYSGWGGGWGNGGGWGRGG
ncbi:hypothetical protein N7449_009354 [Penicillium cf. viridicatum]|uniref:Uncharacterized protein n=1 Tax=Penicillium cf. viridicatum TaxID=2972119 RepID=A0A9W9JBU9_9EURO|nr:hypothetical protein N7449_009354 [Penicillium cf. viridicatum]